MWRALEARSRESRHAEQSRTRTSRMVAAGCPSPRLHDSTRSRFGHITTCRSLTRRAVRARHRALGAAARACGRPPAAPTQTADAKKEPAWDVAAPLGPTHVVEFETDEGTWMNVDVSPDGRTIVFDLLGDLYTMPIEGSGIGPGHAPHERPGVRHAAALQSGRQAHRVQQRPQRPVEHLGDERRRQQAVAGLEGEPLVRQQPDVGAGRPVHLRAQAFREAALARRRRDLAVPRRPAATACRSPRRTAGRRTPASRRSRPTARCSTTARTSRPGENFEYNKNPFGTIYAIIRRDLKTGKERTRRGAAGRLDHAARLARRQVARVHPSRRSRQPSVRARPRDRRRDQRLRRPRQGSAGSLGGARRVRAVRVDARRQGPGHLGQGRPVARRPRREDRHQDSVPRQGRADGQRTAAVQPRGRAQNDSRCACCAT